jgi:hypothetical protein
MRGAEFGVGRAGRGAAAGVCSDGDVQGQGELEVRDLSDESRGDVEVCGRQQGKRPEVVQRAEEAERGVLVALFGGVQQRQRDRPR